MIPTLYPENTTQFTTNGLGRLTDAISCSIKQNKTGTYELTMEYPLDGIHAELITNNRIIYAKPERGKTDQPFRIRNIEKNLNGRMKITARHNCYDLNYYACRQFGQVEVLPYKTTPSLYDSSKYLIGTLNDAVINTINSDGTNWTLIMQYPKSGVYSNSLIVGFYIYAQPELGREMTMFEITYSQEIVEGTKTVHATAPITPYIPPVLNSMTVSQALTLINTNVNQVQACPFLFSANPATSGDTWAITQHEFWTDIPKAVRPLLQGSEGSVVDVFGGEWEFDHYNCILHESRGSDNGVQYRYGKNITSISERINIDDIYTHAFSYWKGTASSSTDTEQGEYYVMTGTVMNSVDSAYTSMFPSQRTRVIDASGEFETKPTQGQLDAYTTKYVTDHSSGTPTVTIQVSIIDLANTQEYEDIAALEQVNLYDTVTIVFPQFGINVKSKITEIEFDVLKEKNNRVTIGDVTTKLSDIIAGNKRDIVKAKYELRKWADRAMERATEALAGWNGGNIRKNYNKNDHKQQSLYVMNTDDKETATKIMTFDGYGFGVSVTNTDEFKYMVDMSGDKLEFSDEFAEDGNTNASFLKRGTIRSGSDNWWNLETDEASFKLEDLTVTGTLMLGNDDIGSTISSLIGSISSIEGTLDDFDRRITALENRPYIT